MTKRVKKRSRRTKKEERQTNWILIGGIIAVGVIALFGLLYLSLQSSTPTESVFTLQDFCESNPDNCMIQGDANAPVTVIEVSDYGCGHCKNFNLDTAGTLKQQYVDTGIVRWMTMPYALRGQTGFPTSPSANAAMCAAEQGQFEAYHTALFAAQGTEDFNNLEGFINIANNLGLDSEELAVCVEEGRHNSRILENIEEANANDVSSTPTFFVNGELVRGNLPLDNFQQVIEQAAAGS
jgi:protein-disulfide isomerase